MKNPIVVEVLPGELRLTLAEGHHYTPENLLQMTIDQGTEDLTSDQVRELSDRMYLGLPDPMKEALQDAMRYCLHGKELLQKIQKVNPDGIIAKKVKPTLGPMTPMEIANQMAISL